MKLTVKKIDFKKIDFRNLPKNSKDFLVHFSKEFLFFSRFFVLLIAYLVASVISVFGKIKFLKNILSPIGKILNSIYQKIIKVFDKTETDSISSLDLIKLANRHLKVKKARTFITIGGMAIGFGSIIFLLSIGYGFQRLVVSKIARLDEMKQIDVSVGQASSLNLNDQTITDFQAIESVAHVLPLVSVVSKVSFNNSVSDVVAYGVTNTFLDQSAIQPIKGKIFDSEAISLKEIEFGNREEMVQKVAGATVELITGAKMEKEIYQVKYSIYPLVWKAVYQQASDKSELLGYTQRVVGEQEATEVWGNQYERSDGQLEGIDDYGNTYSRWVKDEFPLWEKEKCDPIEVNCYEGEYVLINEGNNQSSQPGFITETELGIDRYQIIDAGEQYLEENELIGDISFTINNETYAPVYSLAKNEANIMSLYTHDASHQLLEGELIVGESYFNTDHWGDVGQNKNGQSLGYWVKAYVPLWRKIDCQNCDQLYISETDDNNQQIWQTVYLQAGDLNIHNMSEPTILGQVLGEATVSAELVSTLNNVSASASSAVVATDSAELDDDEWVKITTNAIVNTNTEKEILELNPNSKYQAIVNRAMIKLLGINENDAVGQKFTTTFMFDGDLFGKEDYQAESNPTEFEIIAVIPEEKNASFYLPFIDLKGVGIENYNQIKVVVKDKNDLKKVRQAIESLGYKTSSVVDTIGRINSLFDTLRAALLSIGLIALGVAALGMFNTLTVSLLEKTREVGLMKAMGMKSHEVKRLFLAESIIIGLSGGVIGLGLGFIAGKLLSVLLSTISVTKGAGFIDVAYIPLYLSTTIIILSFVIGFLTGIYPAKRATKISALNALRYE